MNISDVLDSYLTAKVKVGEWENEFLTKFYKPVIDLMINNAIENARTSPMIDREKLEKRLSPAARRRLRGE